MSHILYIKYVTSALRVTFCIHDYENGYDTQYKQPIQYVKPVILIIQYMTSAIRVTFCILCNIIIEHWDHIFNGYENGYDTEYNL